MSPSAGIRKLTSAVILLCLVLSLIGCKPEQPAVIGAPAPDLGVLDLDGTAVNISDFRGAYTVLNFWQGDCAPCLNEIPVLQAFHERHRPDGVRLLAINIGSSPRLVRDTAAEFGVTYELAVDELQVGATRYGVAYFPTTFIVDDKGVLRAKIIGELRDGVLDDRLANLIAIASG